jgi:hypothetical protein
MPKRIEVRSPVVETTDAIPNRKANACTGSMRKTNGNIRTRAVPLPRPGMMPTTSPMAMPMSMKLKDDH